MYAVTGDEKESHPQKDRLIYSLQHVSAYFQESIKPPTLSRNYLGL
jgi:xanthine/uracil permease